MTLGATPDDPTGSGPEGGPSVAESSAAPVVTPPAGAAIGTARVPDSPAGAEVAPTLPPAPATAPAAPATGRAKVSTDPTAPAGPVAPPAATPLAGPPFVLVGPAGVPPGVPGAPQLVPVLYVPLPPPRQRSGRRGLAVAAAVVVLAVMAVGGLFLVGQYRGGVDTVTWRGAPSPSDLPPPQNAPVAEWTNWAGRTVNGAVEAQAAALLANDETGFLAAVDPANDELLDEHRRRFKVLRALGPGVWTENISGLPKASGDRSWDVALRITYCFGTPECQAVPLVVATTWELRDERLVMTSLTPSTTNEIGPRPWEVDDLSVVVGDRVVVAAQKANAWRLSGAMRAGDRAAEVADRLAKWGEPPSKYVIFLAGPDDWNRWYGHDQPDWAAAWAVPVSSTVTEVVIRTEVVEERGLESLLTHELTHVTTLSGDRDGAGRGSWWLVEGIADYATMVDRPVRNYEAISPTKAFVRSGWNGDPAVDPPGADSSLTEASARYGIAFLAVRHLADAYTEEKMLAFFGRVVHDNDSLDSAATRELGVAWSTVKADCAQFIRDSVR